MFDITTLVTDRTAEDLARWLELRDKGFANMTVTEQQEWLSGTMKGAYNVSDLNRVGACLNYLYDRLYGAGYIGYSDIFTAKSNWNNSDIPTVADMTEYLRAVSIIRNALARFPGTPIAPTNARGLSFIQANEIEKILQSVDTAVNNMIAAYRYCGEPICGDV